MKIYAQLKTLSAGYVEGSIPPQFKEELKSPIDLIGTDGVIVLDARLSLFNMFTFVNDTIAKRRDYNDIVGFDIIKANSFRDKGVVLYSTVFNSVL